jgi:hypothetical protein
VSVGGDGGGGTQSPFDWTGASPRVGVAPETAPETAPALAPPLVTSRRERQRARTGPVGWAALVFAILAPPLGFILSLIARALSLRKYRRTTRVLNAALTLSIVFSVILAAGGAVAYAFGLANADEAKIVAESHAFCVSLSKTPGVLDQPAYGWPTEVKSLPETIADMKAYEKRWEELAKIAPQTIREQVASIGAAAKTIVGEVESSNTIERDSNLARMSTVTSATTIPSYTAKYCT